MLRRLLAFVLLTISATLTSAGAQDRPGPPAPAVFAAGRIAGTVVSAESGRPVRFATVTLSPGPGEVVTDDAGRFSFDKLGPAAYTLKVSKPGYLETAYGQVRPGTDTPGKQIRLRDREQLDRLVVPISHGGSISGVVRDDRGDPAFQATVRISRWVMRNGLRRLETVESTETDERGIYRVSLLPPREYVVSAAPADNAIPDSKTGPHPFGFAPMFYPAETSAQASSAIGLGLGEDRANVDLQLPLVPLGRVAGVVLDADGRPASGLRVSLLDRGSLGEESEQSAETDAAGRFTFDRVLPGTYVARAGTGPVSHGEYSVSFRKAVLVLDGKLSWDVTKGPDHAKTFVKFEHETPAADETAGSHLRASASADVSVTSGAATELVLTLEPPRAVSGRVVFDGTSPRPSSPEMQVVLTAITESAESLSAKVAEDGTFVVPNVTAGKYAVRLLGESVPWTLALALAGGADVLDAMLDVPRDRDVRDLTMTLRDRSTELSGTVTNALSQPIGDRTVVVFPSDERLWAAGTQRVQSADLGDDGRFSFARLRPGTYRLAVVEAAEPDEWLDPRFLRQLIPTSVAVTIGDGERKVQDLRVR